MKNAIFFAMIALLCVGCSSEVDNSNRSLVDRADVPYIKGESRTVIHAKPSPEFDDNKWYTNDHCFVEGKDGTLHWFGINNPFPPKGKELYRYHPYTGHATSTDPTKEWKREEFANVEIGGTEYLGAPYVVWHEESGRWAMVIETWRDVRRLEVYWSDDLYKWEETATPILPELLWVGARDPHIMKGDDGKYWIHVVATGNKGVKQSQVIRIKTKDFVTFEEPETVMGINDCTWATLLESPFVVEHDGMWYMFITYAHRRYDETIVIVSETPNNFDYENNTITTIYGHAAEIFDYKGKTYITSCGPEGAAYINMHGVTMAELKWAKQ